MVVLYIIYILLMYFNRFFEKKSNAAFERLKKKYIKKEKLEESDNVSEERQPLSGKSRVIAELVFTICLSKLSDTVQCS